MKPTSLKISALTAAVLSAFAVSQAHAGFTYDLRFSDGTYSKTISANGTYTLQLWGQITGTDTNPGNDGWTDGYVGIASAQTNGGAFTSGGITAAALGSLTNNTAAVGTTNNITSDGVADWGGTSTTTTAGWLFWRGGTPPGVLGGTATAGQSEAVNANTWEILLATYTVTASSVSAATSQTQTTAFNIIVPNSGVKSGVTTNKGIVFYQDQTSTPTNTASANSGVTFVVPAVVSSTDISLTASATHPVIGTVLIPTSGPGKYAGQVLNLGAGDTTGSVVISKAGTDPTEVLLWVTGGSSADADFAALQTALGANGQIIDLTQGGLDTDAAALKANYTGQGVTAGLSASGPTYLVRFPINGDSSPMDFNFTLPTQTLVGITAVPEPASLGMLALGGLGLLARRRSSKR